MTNSEFHRSAASVEDDIRHETKMVYVKRWRTLVRLPAKYADEIVAALRIPDAAQPTRSDLSSDQIMEILRRTVQGELLGLLTIGRRRNDGSDARIPSMSAEVLAREFRSASQPSPAATVTDGSIHEGDVLSYTMADGVGKVTAHVRPHNGSSADTTMEGRRDAIVQAIHAHVGIRQRINVDLTGVEGAADAILCSLNEPQEVKVPWKGNLSVDLRKGALRINADGVTLIDEAGTCWAIVFPDKTGSYEHAATITSLLSRPHGGGK